MPGTKFEPGKWQSGGLARDVRASSTFTSQASKTQMQTQEASQKATTSSSSYDYSKATSLKLSETERCTTNSGYREENEEL